MKKVIIKEIKMDDECVKNLIESIASVIKEFKKHEPVKDHMSYKNDVEAVIASLANRWEWEFEKTWSYVDKLTELNISAAFSIMLKELAIMMDANWEKHISTAPFIYIISMADGKTYKIPTKDVVNFKNFAAFRSVEDAEYAKKVLGFLFDQMF